VTVTVDRIAGGVAVLELPDRSRIEVPEGALPEGTREGDCLSMAQNGELRPDRAETHKRRERNAALFRKLSGPKDV
jgi:hypothetical protein